MSIRFKTKLEKFSDGLYQFHVKVPEEVLEAVKKWRKDKRVICTLAHLEFYAGILVKNGISYVMINKDRRNQLDLHIGEELDCVFRQCENEYGIEVPTSFKTLLAMDKDFSGYFHKLTQGKQRSLLHMIGKIKNEALQVERLMLLCEHLKISNGKLDFKVLNHAFKTSRG